MCADGFVFKRFQLNSSSNHVSQTSICVHNHPGLDISKKIFNTDYFYSLEENFAKIPLADW